MRHISHAGLALLILTPLVLSFIVGMAFWNWYVIDMKQVPIDVTVTNTSLLGFNADTDMLHFGTVNPGGGGTRKTTAVSAEQAMLIIKTKGVAGTWVRVSANNVLLSPNERKDIFFDMTVPNGTASGQYNGTAIITYHRPLPWQ